MKVICDQYKVCKKANMCSHAKPHNFKTIADDFLDDCNNSILCDTYKQNCNKNSIRKYKLEKINESR